MGCENRLMCTKIIITKSMLDKIQWKLVERLPIRNARMY